MKEKAKVHNLKPVVGERNMHENARFSEEFHLQNLSFGLPHKAINIFGS